ncbi:hypothetical protein Taro_032825, partial [Colocasia esculenta]|nr:hypothetical protein [Colocasia esculenta]
YISYPHIEQVSVGIFRDLNTVRIEQDSTDIWYLNTLVCCALNASISSKSLWARAFRCRSAREHIHISTILLYICILVYSVPHIDQVSVGIFWGLNTVHIEQVSMDIWYLNTLVCCALNASILSKTLWVRTFRCLVLTCICFFEETLLKQGFCSRAYLYVHNLVLICICFLEETLSKQKFSSNTYSYNRESMFIRI